MAMRIAGGVRHWAVTGQVTSYFSGRGDGGLFALKLKRPKLPFWTVRHRRYPQWGFGLWKFLWSSDSLKMTTARSVRFSHIISL